MVAASTAAAGTDALPSWNDGPAKSVIIEFVQTATDKASMRFVPPPERIAVFDNDGTLWASHPIYVQLAFALDRVKALAPQHPEWKTKQPFKAVLKGDLKTVMAGGETAAKEVESWRKAGKLPFPRLAPDRIEQLKDTLDYPPLGSVQTGTLESQVWEASERLSAEPDDEEESDRKPPSQKHGEDS